MDPGSYRGFGKIIRFIIVVVVLGLLGLGALIGGALGLFF